MENIDPPRKQRELNSTESTRGRRLSLFLSLSLNLGLLLFLTLAWRKAAPGPVATSSTAENTTPSNNPIHAKRLTAKSASAWAQLESADLAIYAANLRAAGCPQKTIRDILLPLIEEKFEPHSESPHFWASFSQQQAAAAARAKEASVLGERKNQAIKELLGFVWTSEGLKQLSSGEEIDSFGFLEYEHAEKSACIGDRFDKQFLQAGLSYRTDRRLATYKAWRQEISEVLSTTELEETELRGILAIYQARNPNLHKAGLSGSELRQLMVLRRDLCNPLPTALLTAVDEPSVTDWSAEQQFNVKARALLGDSRFINYLKSCDAGIERTLGVLQKEHLPRNLVLQLFDLRQQSMTAAQEIRQMPLRRAEKRKRLAAVRENAVEELTSLRHIATDDLLLRINQDWIQEIANP